MNEAKIKQMLKEKHNIDIPTDAKLVKSTKTARFETYVWMHTCGSYLVDGDRIVVKVERAKHGNPGISMPERKWSEGLVPPQEPPKKPDKKAVAVLIDTENPFYIWDKKPAPRAPCFLVQKKSELTIYDMEGNIIGKGTPAP